jgi:GTP diphosphokinase / guanosine-3',5'-bis(diphosphate) 3'-diphosphatase
MANSIMNRDNYNILPGIFEALKFAAYKHRKQKRKGAVGIPYINHPIDVANLLITEIEEPSPDLIIAALLHDVIEDTRTKFSDLEKQFGPSVTDIVREVTDDMTLPSIIRKREQINKAESLSYNARCIKIADKTCNINDLLFTRIKWSRKRKIEYIVWANSVVLQIRDTHEGLISQFDEMLKKAGSILNYSFNSY